MRVMKTWTGAVLFSCLVPKSRVKAAIDLEGQEIPVSIPTEGGFSQGAKAAPGSSEVDIAS